MNSSDDDDDMIARFQSVLGDIAEQENVVDGLRLIRLFVRIPAAADRARVLALASELASPGGDGVRPLC